MSVALPHPHLADRRPETLFLPSNDPARGQRLVLFHPPARSTARGAVIYIHPFGEEMNKARHMAAWQSRALAEAGFAVMQIDLLGCGDSSGDFGDAAWEDWLVDVADAVPWLQARCQAPLVFWGLRAGCLIALDAARRIDVPAAFLLWQPVVSGKTVLQQFLRQKLAADLASGAAKGKMEALRAELAAGRPVEISGYRLSAAMAAGLEATELTLPSGRCRVAWMEVSSRDDATLAPASLAVVERWRHADHDVASAVVSGPAFWQTTEIEDAPALIAATLSAIDQVAP